MPFDSNGNFSLSAGYLAVSGQTILPSQHNPVLEDIGSALSEVLLRSGVAPMTGPLNMNSFRIQNMPEAAGDGDPVTLGQLQELLSNLATVPPGAVQGFRRKTPPTGWVKEGGGTIGSSLSGATARAASDTEALFTVLWTEFTNTELPIQDSSGAASTRGGSAASDFAANKRMPLFDSRTRFLRGSDDGLGFNVGLVVGVSQADVFKAHTHTGTTEDDGQHDHDMPRSTVSGTGPGVGYQFGDKLDDNGPDTLAAGLHDHDFTTNATGDALETRPRASVVLLCIKL